MKSWVTTFAAVALTLTASQAAMAATDVKVGMSGRYFPFTFVPQVDFKTLELVFFTSIIILLVTFPVGVYSAIKPKSWFSRFTMGASTVGVAVPVFLTAIALIYLFGVELQWLPAYGRGETVNIWGWESGLFTLDGLKHLILLSISLSSIMMPLYIRLIRSEMMEVLETEYIKFA